MYELGHLDSHCTRGITVNLLLLVSLLVWNFIVPGATTSAADRPNILVIMADDCTFNDLPVYGGKNARTPHIDRLASEGLVFNRAYLSSAMCQPCRAELYTGQYPLRNGCAWNHSASRPAISSMPQHLGKLGYRVGLAGKVHVLPADAFPFETVLGFDPNCVRNPTQGHELAGIRKFMGGKGDDPFCLVVALVEPHVPWVMGDASEYPPDEIQLPLNIADTPQTRQDFSSYLAEITYMDSQVHDVLRTLEESGRGNDTLVIFTSEQGAQFPGCKWTNWDTGLHTAFIVRRPDHVRPGTRTDALVQYADVLPTLLEILGADTDEQSLDGSSFLPVLLGKSSSHRQYAYGMHNNLPEGPAYPIRTVFDGEYRYIRNLTPDEIYIEKHLMGLQGGGGLNNPYWPTWVGDAWNNPHIYRLVKRYVSRPPEELYHTNEDPFELDNLAGDARHAKAKAKLSAALDEWMKSQSDPGAPVDTTEALHTARKGDHLYGLASPAR